MIANVHSLWLIPPQPIYKETQDKIDQLSKEYGTPRFTPHITLLGDVDPDRNKTEKELIKISNEIMKALSPLEIQLSNVQGESNKWWKRIYISANKTDTLNAAYITASQKFGTIPDDYQPHISLLYSDELPEEITTSLVKQLDKEYIGRTFQVTEMELINANGHVRDWKVVKKFK